MNLVVLGDRDIEIDNADTLIGPQQVGGLDVLMVNAVLVKMGQPVGGLAHDAHGIIQRQRLGINQIGDIQTFHILKDDVRRLLGVGHAVRPDHLHHMRMVGQIGQGLVLAAQPFVHAAAVLGHQLDDPHHVAQGIEHLVGHTEAAAAQLFLNAEAIRQDEILRQVHQVIGELRHDHGRAAHIRGGVILGLGQNQVI